METPRPSWVTSCRNFLAAATDRSLNLLTPSTGRAAPRALLAPPRLSVATGPRSLRRLWRTLAGKRGDAIYCEAKGRKRAKRVVLRVMAAVVVGSRTAIQPNHEVTNPKSGRQGNRIAKSSKAPQITGKSQTAVLRVGVNHTPNIKPTG